MQATALSSRPSSARASLARSSHRRAPRAALSVVRAAAKQLQPQHQERSGLDGTILALAGLLLQPQLAAWADDAVIEAAASTSAKVQAAAADAAQKSVDAPAWLGYALLLSPLLLYGFFTFYRSQVNPRAKFTDFLFIVAGIAVVGNLVSILAFKVRLF
eukprot:GHRQ01003877.1.p1 GENE.GHRQ01003877.1~~GHRQ01003877.1.p1  ORF type:complete len:159 (+),score=37.19 GHRQ01003877.1:107-583(+)